MVSQNRYYKYQSMATLFLSLGLIATGGGLCFQGVNLILSNENLIPSNIALYAAIISVASKEIMYHMTMNVAKKTNNQLLIANAWHHRSDSISSLVALLGILGAQFGYPYL